MAISIRYYLLLDGGSLRRIANELPFGRDAIPEFAGTRQRTADVVLELQDAKPVRIVDPAAAILSSTRRAVSTSTCVTAWPIAWTS